MGVPMPSPGTLAAELRELNEMMGAETDEEIIEEFLKVVEVRSR